MVVAPAGRRRGPPSRTPLRAHPLGSPPPAWLTPPASRNADRRTLHVSGHTRSEAARALKPQLEAHFSRFGAVQEVRVATDRSTGLSRGFSFVVFEEEGKYADNTRDWSFQSVAFAAGYDCNDANIDCSSKNKAWRYFGSILIGLVSGISIGEATEYFTSYATKHLFQ